MLIAEMGTKIQCKTYLPALYSVKDLNGHMNYSVGLRNHEEQTLRSVQHYDFFASCLPLDGYFEYDKEKVRQTILKHESIFRQQLQELHRLHKRQMELMSELKMRGLLKNPIKDGTEDKCNGNTMILEVPKRTNYCITDLNEPILLEEAPILASDGNLGRINCIANGIERMDKLSQNHIIDGGNRFKNALSVGGKNRHEHWAIDINTDSHSNSLHTAFPCNNTKAEHRKKNTIFGVVISEGNEEQNFERNGGKMHMNGDTRSVSCHDGDSHSFQLNGKKVKGCSLLGLDYANGKNIWNFAPKECLKYETTKSHNCLGNNTDCKPAMATNFDAEKPKGALPWFIVKSQCSLNQSEDGRNYFQTNLDLLKKCSQQASRKSQINEDFSQILNAKQEAKPFEHSKIEVGDSATVKKLFGVPIFNSSKDLNTADSISIASFADVHEANSKNIVSDDVVSRYQSEAKDNAIQTKLENNISGLSHQIDLNMSLDEEEISPSSSLPQSVVEIATTERNREAPTVLESEKIASLEAESMDTKLAMEEFKEPCEEVLRQAAEAIVSISQNGTKSLESETNDCLKWLAELSTYEANGHECRTTEASIPDGMDYFEFATLKLRDMKEEGNCYEPTILEIHNKEVGATTQSKRPRRGQARRGRQRKDFQRDVLPSIVSLSKHKLNEDILTFEELLRTTGCSWQSSLSQKKAAKNGRRRKRHHGDIIKTMISPPPINQPLCNEMEVEKANLTGWGKRTRRLPRHRCPSTNHVPLMQC